MSDAQPGSGPQPTDRGNPLEDTTRGFLTRSIHAGLAPDPATGAILTPIYQTTTYVQDAVGQHKGYTYTRDTNPTVASLEKVLGALEDAPPAVCTGTGLAAEALLFFATLSAGDHVVCGDVVYGGTVRQLREIFEPLGVRTTFVDATDLDAVRAAITPKTRLVFVESPANPTLKLTDLVAVAVIAHQAGAWFAVDNTILTAALQRPLDLGADIVVYSTTKYVEGHNATVGGALVTRDEALAERFRFLRKTLGCPQSPFEAWLTLRGLKTLALRVEQHARHALSVAQWLESHPRVTRVYHPFLASFPQRELALRQQRAGGGLVAFEVEGGADAGIAVMNSVKLCSLAENLGAVETIVTHPASMTHGYIPREARERLGIAEGLIRLSVGLEEPADIIADLDRALRAAYAGRFAAAPIAAGA